VGVNYRARSDKADEIVKEICDAGGDAIAIGGDVAIRKDVETIGAGDV